MAKVWLRKMLSQNVTHFSTTGMLQNIDFFRFNFNGFESHPLRQPPVYRLP